MRRLTSVRIPLVLLCVWCNTITTQVKPILRTRIMYSLFFIVLFYSDWYIIIAMYQYSTLLHFCWIICWISCDCIYSNESWQCVFCFSYRRIFCCHEVTIDVGKRNSSYCNGQNICWKLASKCCDAKCR